MAAKKPFWETKSLAEMNPQEWESLCDGCGRCCIYVLHNEETDEVFETDIACKLFDVKKRRCTDYENRMKKVKDCVQLTPDNAGTLKWMPPSCAYRRLGQAGFRKRSRNHRRIARKPGGAGALVVLRSIPRMRESRNCKVLLALWIPVIAGDERRKNFKESAHA